MITNRNYTNTKCYSWWLAAAAGYDFHPLAGDLGQVPTSTGRTGT
jgi:hypothetical protein